VNNTASQRVIQAYGGRYAGLFASPSYGTEPKQRYLVDFSRLRPEAGSG
jgi:hypothetical protein